MPTAAHWIAGARPRTLPAAVAPVLVGTGLAAFDESFVWWKAALALVVALALQVGVNYANDYSDGIRGTDLARVGPIRLVGSGLATPRSVRRAALLSFGVAALAGLALALSTNLWLIAVGAAAIVAAWFYTGGRHPYGYVGLGEVSVFVFFGLVATVGTSYVQTEAVTWPAVWAGSGVGAFACAILVANNLRDIPTDRDTGKRTLAVKLGDRRTRALFTLLHVAALVLAVVVAAQTTWWVLLAWVCLPLSVRAMRVVRRRATGPELVAVLRDIGLAELVYAAGVLAGCLIGTGGS